MDLETRCAIQLRNELYVSKSTSHPRTMIYMLKEGGNVKASIHTTSSIFCKAGIRCIIVLGRYRYHKE